MGTPRQQRYAGSRRHDTNPGGARRCGGCHYPGVRGRIERRTWIISEGGATTELVLDSGEVVAGERTSPICEIELELKQGDPAALFAVARRTDAGGPARRGVQGKAERGRRPTGGGGGA